MFAVCRACRASFTNLDDAAHHDPTCPWNTCGDERWHGTNYGYNGQGCRGPRCRAAHNRASLASYYRAQERRRRMAS